jgi:hypothetical protein
MLAFLTRSGYEGGATVLTPALDRFTGYPIGSEDDRRMQVFLGESGYEAARLGHPRRLICAEHPGSAAVGYGLDTAPRPVCDAIHPTARTVLAAHHITRPVTVDLSEIERAR